jgi:hypothetical protein
LNPRKLTGTFDVKRSGVCRFVRLVNTPRNHHGNDRLGISSFEILAWLCESRLFDL